MTEHFTNRLTSRSVAVASLLALPFIGLMAAPASATAEFTCGCDPFAASSTQCECTGADFSFSMPALATKRFRAFCAVNKTYEQLNKADVNIRQGGGKNVACQNVGFTYPYSEIQCTSWNTKRRDVSFTITCKAQPLGTN